MTRRTCSAVRRKSVSRSRVALTTSAISTSRSSMFNGGEVWAVGFMLHAASEGCSEAGHDFDAGGSANAIGADSNQRLHRGSGADASRSLDAGAMADHAAHKGDVIHRGYAAVDASASLHKIRASDNGKLAGKDFFVHAEQACLDNHFQ